MVNQYPFTVPSKVGIIKSISNAQVKDHIRFDNVSSGVLFLWYHIMPGSIIRASVDALCRDDPSEISRDTRTKCLKTRRESLARPSKHTNNNF